MAGLTHTETSYGAGSRPLGISTWAQVLAMDTTGLRAGDHVEVSDFGYASFYWSGTIWRPRGMTLIDASGAPVVCPNNTNENVLATVTIPGVLMGLNGGLVVHSTWTVTNNANTKTPRLRFGGAAGTKYMEQALTTSADMADMRRIRNRGAANSQVGSFQAAATSASPLGAGGSAVIVSALDTSQAQDLVFTAQKGVAADNITLEAREVWLVP